METSQTLAPTPAQQLESRRERLLFPGMAALYARAEPVLYATLRVMFGIVPFTHGVPKALGMSRGSMADPMAGSINLIQNVMGLPRLRMT